MSSFRDLRAPAFESRENISLFYAATGDGKIDESVVTDLLHQFDNDKDRETIVALYGKLCLAKGKVSQVCFDLKPDR